MQEPASPLDQVCPFAEKQHVRSNILFMIGATFAVIAVTSLCLFLIIYESALGRLIDWDSVMHILIRVLLGIICAFLILLSWCLYVFSYFVHLDTRLYTELGLQISLYPMHYFGWQRTILFEEIVRYNKLFSSFKSNTYFFLFPKVHKL